MTIEKIKDALDKIEIENLHPRYDFMSGCGSTRIPEWLYKSFIRLNISDNSYARGFHEPIKRFYISREAVNFVSEPLKELLKDYLIDSLDGGDIITAVGDIPIKILSRGLIDIKISLGSACAASSLQELIEDTNLEYNYCHFLEGINISSDADFGDFVVSPTNSSFDILPSEIFGMHGNELIIDRSVIKFNRQFKTSLYLLEWLDAENYRNKIKESSKDKAYFSHASADGFLFFDKSDVFDYKPNNNYYLDLLCYVFSVHFQKSILNTWRFVCPENTLLRVCCDFIPNYKKNSRPIFDMSNITGNRVTPIDISKEDIHDIMDFYNKINNICDTHSDKERFIKSMLHYNNISRSFISRSTDTILKSQELVNAFACLVDGNLNFAKIFNNCIPDFIANNPKDKKSMIDDLDVLRNYRNAQPHPDKENLKFTTTGVSESVLQNCLQYYKRLILKCIQENGLCPS